MRLVFLLLLLANLAVFAWRLGALGPPADAGREPQRLALQIAPEKIRPLTPSQLAALRNPGRGPGPDAAKPACVEFGDFDDAGLARIESRLAELALGERLRVQRIAPRQAFVVFLPAPASRAEAERLAQDLRVRGVRDFVATAPDSPLPNAILLGSFRDLGAAQRLRADLTRRGVKSVQLGDQPVELGATRFEIRDADAALSQHLAEIQKEFPDSQIGVCAN